MTGILNMGCNNYKFPKDPRPKGQRPKECKKDVCMNTMITHILRRKGPNGQMAQGQRPGPNGPGPTPRALAKGPIFNMLSTAPHRSMDELTSEDFYNYFYNNYNYNYRCDIQDINLHSCAIRTLPVSGTRYAASNFHLIYLQPQCGILVWGRQGGTVRSAHL